MSMNTDLKGRIGMRQIDTILLVEDIRISKEFYTEILGLEILHDWESMIVFKNRLAIHQANLLLPKEETVKFLEPGKQGRGNVIVYVETINESLVDCMKRLQDKKVTIVHGIRELPWQRIFRINDPDNHIIEVGEAQAETDE